MSESRQHIQSLQHIQLQLVELQTQLAFQEDVIRALDDVVIAQQQRLDQLEQSNMRLEKQLSDMSAWMAAQSPVEAPPHY